MKTVFLRVIEAEDKAGALKKAIQVQHSPVDAQTFAAVPRSPFAYWVSDEARNLFRSLPQLHGKPSAVWSTNPLNEDFRFARLFWEPPVTELSTLRWVPWAKGGPYSPIYYDIHTLIRWSPRRRTYGSFLGTVNRPLARPASLQHFFRPGLTWSRRTQGGLSLRAMPAGSIFADKGPAVFVDEDSPDDLLALLAVVNSMAFRSLVELQMAFGSYEVGVLQRTPIPRLESSDFSELSKICHVVWSQKRTLDTCSELSHAFILPALLQVTGSTLVLRGMAWSKHVADIEERLTGNQAEIDDRCFGLYGISDEDRAAMIRGFEPASENNAGDDDEDIDGDRGENAVDLEPQVANLVSWFVGVALGRFDLRLAIGKRPDPEEPEPFDPLPLCSPGMLTGDDGLPLEAPPDGYPVDFPIDGILADDPGHDRDLTTRAHQVFKEVFGEDEGAYWHEAAQILEPRTQSLRRWLQSSFFAQHIKQYSKSRRKAPIYWQLATPSASYSVWLYYHRFTRDTLFKVHGEFVTPKVQHEERRLADLRQEAGPSPTASHRKEIAAQEDFVAELRAFQTEVARVEQLWNPDLNDGVIINFAPLWRLVPQHKPWQKECKKVWDRLCEGDYDWSHLAMHLWPERVVPRCAEDRSLAIAHGLEDELWQEDNGGKWHPRKVTDARIQELIHERTSPAVKAALDDLLEAPAPATGKKHRAPKRRAAQPRTTRSPKAPSRGEAGSQDRTSEPVDPATLDAVRDAVAAAQDGASKAEVLDATGLSGGRWNTAIKELLERGDVVKTGKGRGTRYHRGGGEHA